MNSRACFLIERHKIIYFLELIIPFSKSRSRLKNPLSRSRFLKFNGAGASFCKSLEPELAFVNLWSQSRIIIVTRAGAVPNLAGSEVLNNSDKYQKHVWYFFSSLTPSSRRSHL